MKKQGVVLVTGATGFVGRGLLPILSTAGWKIRALTRQAFSQKLLPDQIEWHQIAKLGDDSPLAGCSAVVHLAARVHVMRELEPDPLSEFRRVNVVGTERLARQAVAAGVRRFVYLSSIKVCGEETPTGRPFFADDSPHPEDPYGISKHEAEIALLRVASETGLEVVIIRPPLVYGPGVKGNFRTMLNWLQCGIPLPLASLDNRRSLVSLDNLCDLIRICLEHPAAVNEVFLVSDGHDLSTSQLLYLAGDTMGCPARLFPFPPAWIERGAAMLGKRGLARRLCGNLQVDIDKAKTMLGWSPPMNVQAGLHRLFDADKKG
jgi:UDP-glucose 4-epimerase